MDYYCSLLYIMPMVPTHIEKTFTCRNSYIYSTYWCLYCTCLLPVVVHQHSLSTLWVAASYTTYLSYIENHLTCFINLERMSSLWRTDWQARLSLASAGNCMSKAFSLTYSKGNKKTRVTDVFHAVRTLAKGTKILWATYKKMQQVAFFEKLPCYAEYT